MHKIVFIDTNIFLHYQPFDQISWTDLLKAETATIIIPPITLRELNKHKELHPRKNIRDRAGEVIKRLTDLFERGPGVNVMDKVQIEFDDRDPAIDYVSYQLNSAIQDDNLIASILLHRDSVSNANIILVTSDAGLLLLTKAGRQGIETIKIPDRYKIPEQSDPNESKVKQLEQEIRELKSRAPILSLNFKNGNQYITFVLPIPIKVDAIDVEKKLVDIKNKYPKREKTSSSNEAELSETIAKYAAVLSMETVSPEEIDRYNSDLDKFYESYAQYFEKSANYENMNLRTIVLIIVLTNDGTAPAEDIDVFLHFPDGFRLIEEHNLAKHPKLPEPPEKPKTISQMMFRSVNLGPMVSSPYLHSFDDIGPVTPPPNVSPPNIRRTKSYDVDIHVQKIKHNLQEAFEPIYVVFDSFENAKSFEIEYRIFAANIPHELTGTLNVVVQKDTDIV